MVVLVGKMRKLQSHMMTLVDLPFLISEKHGKEHIAFKQKFGNTINKISISEYIIKSEQAGAFLSGYGLQPKERVLSILINSFDWFCIEQGVFLCDAIHVPLSIMTSSSELEYIILNTEPALIILNSQAKKKQVTEILKRLKLSITVINLKEQDIFQTPPDTLPKGRPTEESIAVILYTSGSTRQPKGVALTHKNIVTAITEFSALDIFDDCKNALSLLPFNFSGERKLCYSYLLRGICICVPGKADTIPKSVQFFNPDIMGLVPYLMQNLLDVAGNGGSSNFKGLRIICGGAQVSQYLISRFEQLGSNVFEVYGLTETASLLSYNTFSARRTGTAGVLAKSVMVKLSDQSEIWVKGEVLMKGYWVKNNVAENGLNREGWFETGDIGHLDENGFLHITGRIGNVFKNTKGEFIYAEQIEKQLTELFATPFVMVFGNDTGYLSVIIKSENQFAQEDIEHKLNLFNRQKVESFKINRYLAVDQWDEKSVSNNLKYSRNGLWKKFKNEPFLNLF